MKAKPLVFNWVQVGTNCEAPIIEVNCFEYRAEVFKAYDTLKWNCIINGHGRRGFNSESDAKAYVENLIRQKVDARIVEAVRDINLLTDTTVSIEL